MKKKKDILDSVILSFVLILITFNDERKIRDILFSSILISFALDHLYRVFFQLICHNSNIFYNGKKVSSTILLWRKRDTLTLSIILLWQRNILDSFHLL